MTPSGQSKILLVDDTVENLLILFEGLRHDHSLITARSGEKALTLAAAHPQPDLILLDVMMPGLDGFEVCRRLKENPATSEIPVVFITALHDEESEVRALSVGGVDFITKPIQPMVVKARVKTHLALRQAYRDLATSLDQLRWERELIEDILLTMREHPLQQEPFVRALLTPVERTAGDIFLLGRRPDGFYHALVGDCTGHGLPAAIVGPMVMDIFLAMTRKGFLPEEILPEMNAKLHHRAPANIFMAGVFLELTPGLDAVRLWNGGMPEPLLWRNGTWPMAWPSSHPPLGVISAILRDDWSPAVPLRPGDRLFLYSDGVVESRSPESEMFGVARLKHALDDMTRKGEPLETLVTRLNAFRGDDLSEDDITLIEFRSTPLPTTPERGSA
ncbi:MAG: SpoIIE family protein phosphatase [Magnetococcales bacterium]|nr:SpoIIE family protein phosphatase [Magnetococcales bacterium]